MNTANNVIDARGLSCPQPVLATLKKIDALGSGKVEVLVDAEVSRENVSRALQSRGWELQDVRQESDGYRIVAVKGRSDE